MLLFWIVFVSVVATKDVHVFFDEHRLLHAMFVLSGLIMFYWFIATYKKEIDT